MQRAGLCFATLLVSLHVSSVRSGVCPMGCYCDDTVVDCSSLMEFPTDLLADTTVFKVSHLNVYEIPAYAFAKLHNITKVEFVNCNIANVSPFAFYKVPSLEEIIFDKTVIGNLESYSFSGLQNMTRIQFSNARIGRIKPFAFFEMSDLTDFNIINTHIQNFYTHSFYDCHRFGSLFIKGSNISDFVTGAFEKVADIKAVTVEDNAFWHMHCDVLDGMERLSENFLFIQNTFYCNCSLSWLFSDTYSHLGAYRGVSTCHGPDNMKTVSLASVGFSDLGCKSRTPPASVKCEQHELKPRPKAPAKGVNRGADGSGTVPGKDPRNTASVVPSFSILPYVLYMIFIAASILHN